MPHSAAAVPGPGPVTATIAIAIAAIERHSPREAALAEVELRLAGLSEALRERDTAGIDRHASQLHRALADALDQFSRAAPGAGLPPALRLRLAMASAQVAAQRESLVRATAACDRAIDVLLPRQASALYSTHGNPDRAARAGALQA